MLCVIIEKFTLIKNIKFKKIRDKDILLTYLQIILSKEDELYEVNKFTFK